MTERPPFQIGVGISAPVKGGLWYEMHIEEYSDGEERTWPGKPHYRPSSNNNYRIKLATAWAEEKGISSVQRGNYYLNYLPRGYETFEMDQPAGNGQVYKRLFGHPTGRYYDSTIRFQVHFFWLMSGMEGNCQCIICSGNKPPPIHRGIYRDLSKPREASGLAERPRRHREIQIQDSQNSTRSNSSSRLTTLASGREKRQHKPTTEAYAVDEESTPDAFKDYLRKLYQFRDSRKGIEDDIDEEASFDWRAERKSLPIHFTQIEQQHSFIPRIGELVLWCKYFPSDHFLIPDKTTGEYKFYSFEQDCFHGFPDWRGGVVTAVPTASATEASIDFGDILENLTKKTALNTSGFRVETLPNPNSAEKSLSKQYAYVPLRHIRPLSQWQQLVRGITMAKLHSSIYNALTCMTSVSLLEKFWFKGSWPDASVKCKGIYIGSELITVGDAVRIAPSPLSTTQRNGSKLPIKCTDLLVVTSIRLNLEDIKLEHVTPHSPYLSSRSTITLIGSAYTLDVHRAFGLPSQGELHDDLETPSVTFPTPVHREKVKSLFRPVGTGDYGTWYPLHPGNQRYEISFERVLGRLYEADAVRLWTGLSRPKTPGDAKGTPTLDFDVPGILSGRAYATSTDERLPEPSSPGQTLWHWADTRALGLALETVNGLEVGPYHRIRDKLTLRAWRAMLRIIDGGSADVYGKDTRLEAKSGTRGRKKGSRMVNGRIVGPDESEVGESEEEGEGRGGRRMPLGSSSQMANAALPDREEESGDGDRDGDGDDDDGEELLGISGLEDAAGGGSGISRNPSGVVSEIERSKSRSRSRIAPKAPRTKEQIMTSTELDSEDDSALAFLEEPAPLARGGTEESEGGDYNPKIEDFQKRLRGREPKRMKYGDVEERW